MSKIAVGIDIGSRTVKVVFLEDGEIIRSGVEENSFNTLEVCKKLLDGISYDVITATGYGRHLFADNYESHVISEIKAFSIGARYLFPDCRTVIDIGGQDTKVIALDDTGHVRKFEMNDKCAAGTGRFLEIMAMALRFDLNEFGKEALNGKQFESINSMCTVFAESEVISMLAKGIDRNNIARGIHQSVVNRSLALLNRVGVSDEVVFMGGVAYNHCIIDLFKKSLNTIISVPDKPQIVGALGAAFHSYNEH